MVGKCFVTFVHIVIKSEKIGIIEIFISFLTDNKIFLEKVLFYFIFSMNIIFHIEIYNFFKRNKKDEKINLNFFNSTEKKYKYLNLLYITFLLFLNDEKF